MNRIRRVTAWAAAVLLLLAAGTGAQAEITAEKKTERGRVTEITWKDENGNVTAGPEGYATVRYEYAHQKTTETYYDAEGFPFETEGGYYGRIVSTDSFLVTTEYIGINGKPTNTKMGYAKVERRSFMFGAERYTIFYDETGRTVVVPSLGYAQVETLAYGKELTGRIYMDEKGNPVDTPAGYAAMRKKMNRNHVVIREWYEHADGSAATGPDGWSRCEILRDANNKDRITAVEYYDAAGSLTDAGGYAREVYQYAKGVVITSRFDAAGNIIPYGGNAVSVRRKTKDDQLLEEMFLNEAGEPTTLPEGYAGVKYSYNSAGQLELTQYLDTEGGKTTCSAGYSAVRQTWNMEGRLISRNYLDMNGQKAVNAAGVSEEQFEYDEDGRLTGSRKYDASGSPVGNE